MIKGIAASPGISIGKAAVLKEGYVQVIRRKVENTEGEIIRFRDAAATAKEQLKYIRDIAEKNLGEDKARIFEAHILMLEDPEFVDAVENEIKNNHINAEYALGTVVDEFASMFRQIGNEYMRERAADIKDIGKRIRNILLGIENTSLLALKEQCIIVAKDLTPSDTAQMDKSKVLGFATDAGGRTSHSAIMARTMEIPAVVGTGNVTEKVSDGDTIILDAIDGNIIINPDLDTLKAYQLKKEGLEKEHKELSVLKDFGAVTIDGKRIEVAGNIGSPKDIGRILENGGDGVGLFRTEFLYMGRSSMPDEETQFEAYREAAVKMGGRPIIIRTFDIGGDKKLPYLNIPEEANPFLGYRAIRVCLDQTDIFKTQLRALLRASYYGKIRVMFPMISGVEEVRSAKAILEEVKKDLRNEQKSFDENIEVGIMVEIPSAAIMSDSLAKEIDFFSIGTNDLIQYTTAVDRMNEKVADLYDPYHPAVLRLIKIVSDNAHRAGKWVGMCGEMAGDPRLIPVLLALGIDELSMSAGSILYAKKVIRKINVSQQEKNVDLVLSAGSIQEVRSVIEHLYS
jgi:phosphotransferase system enzyme I (PtsI)